jgi:amidase
VPDLHDLTALEQAAAIRRGDLDPADLTAHYLARIEALDDRIGAFVTVTADRARAAATGTSAGQLDALAGVPTAIKDLTPLAGVRTTLGSAAYADWVPDFDGHVVTAVREAGMPILGKTATSELGAALYSETEIGPPVRNPWRLTDTAGGSSGGAAAAVAAGLLPVAHGSDGGGSLRIPAALCGVVGYKSSRGVVPLGPGNFGAFGLPVQGGIARTVADVAAFTAVLAKPRPDEHYTSPLADPATLLDLDRPGPLRIGRFTRPMLAEGDVDPACVAAVDTAAGVLSDLGHEVVDIEPPFDPGVMSPFGTVWAVLAALPPPRGGSEEVFTPLVRWLRAGARTASAIDLVQALAGLQARVATATARLDRVDLTLCPTLAGTGAPIGAFVGAGGPAEDLAAQARFSPYCAAFNLMGAPAISLPLGATADGRPVGAMLGGRPGSDRTLLGVAAAVERERPWSHNHPEIWHARPHS